MRHLLSALTVRGRAFIAAGLTAIACAVLLGQPAMTQVGTLVVALPLVALAFVSWRRSSPQVSRSVHPALVRAGEPAQIELHLRSETGRTDGVLLIEDTVGFALGARPRFVLQGLGPAWERTLTYPVRSELRGRFPLGPLVVRVTDPFGLVERRTTLAGTDDLLVTPQVVALEPIVLTGGWQGSGEHRPQAFAAGSAEDVSVREYRRGDDLRRVHWHSSARLGELMVRREEQPWEARATLLLDNRSVVHRGQGIASSFEPAVVAAASLVVHLEQHGYAIRLVCADGVLADGAQRSLEQLALCTLSQRADLDLAWSGEQSRGGMVLGVFGAHLDRDIAALRRIRHDAGLALGLVLDAEQWSAGRLSAGPDAAAAPLLAHGWRAAGIGPRDRLEDAWRDLGRTTAHGKAHR